MIAPGCGKAKARCCLDEIQAEAAAISFVAAEKEKFVLDDRPADDAAKLVERQRAFGNPGRDVVEKVASVERVAAKIFEHRTVKLVAARFCDDADLAAGARAELGRKVARINAKFLNILETTTADEMVTEPRRSGCRGSRR